jgi:hypothetical protein
VLECELVIRVARRDLVWNGGIPKHLRSGFVNIDVLTLFLYVLVFE